jgi:hypothetical protein
MIPLAIMESATSLETIQNSNGIFATLQQAGKKMPGKKTAGA